MFKKHIEVATPKQASKMERLNKILAYLREHQGEVVHIADVANVTGMTIASASYDLKELRDRGSIGRRGKHGAFMYTVRVKTVRTKGKKPKAVQTPKVAPADVEKEPSKVSEPTKIGCSDIESLVWEYIRISRNTDLLTFLSWVEQRK